MTRPLVASAPSKGSRSAVFLDRDGAINKMIYNPDFGLVDSPSNVNQFELLPGVGEAVHTINEMNLLSIVVSNQPGIAKGKFSRAILDGITQKMKHALADSGGLTDVFYCLHHPDAIVHEYRVTCDCRKPKPGLLKQAAAKLNVDLRSSYMVGDGLTDVLAGKAAGCRTILLGKRKCDLCEVMSERNAWPDFIVSDLVEAIRLIQRERYRTA